MALARTPLIAFSSTSNATSYTSGTASPSANSLLTLHVLLSESASATPAELVAGDIDAWGATWVKRSDVSFTDGGTLRFRIQSFTTELTAAPGSDDVVVDASGGAGGNQTGCMIFVTQYTGHGGYVQQNTNFNNSDDTTWDVTLGSAPAATSIVEVCVIHDSASATAGDTGWNGDGDISYSSPTVGGELFAKQNDQSATGTISTSDKWGAVALEIAEASSVTVTVDTPGAVTWAGKVLALATSIAPTPGAVTWAGASGITLTTSTSPTPGAITWTGQSVPLSTSIAVTPGAITWTGATDITVSVATVVSVDTPGAVTWAGQDLQLTTTLTPTPGVITWSGATDVAVGQVITQTVDTPGAITWTGQDVGLVISIAPTPGAVTWSGQTIGLATTVTPTPGALTWAGQQLALANLMTLDPGAIIWTGADDITAELVPPEGPTVAKRGFMPMGHPLEHSGRFRHRW